MRSSVELDTDFGLEAIKIEDVRTDGLLPAELEASKLPSAKNPPESPLRLRRRPTHRLGVSSSGLGDAGHYRNSIAPVPPLLVLPHHPLSLEGEGSVRGSSVEIYIYNLNIVKRNRRVGAVGNPKALKVFKAPATVRRAPPSPLVGRKRPRAYSEWRALARWGQIPPWEPIPAGYLMRAAREGANLTQTALAKKLDCTQQAIAQAERWGSNPTVEFLDRWAAACGKRLKISI